jgi:hypothetical protein
MKTLTTILSFLIAFAVFGQTEINQRTDRGQKSGEWREFHVNGKTDEVWCFEPAKRKMSEEEAFFQGVTYDKDSSIYYEELKWSEKYEYNDKWELRRIVRMETSQKPVYFYGPNREIALQTDEFYFTDKVGKNNIR